MDSSLDLQQAHALLDRLPSAKLGLVRSLLEALVGDDEFTAQDRDAIRAGLQSSAEGRTFTHDEILADFGLTVAEFDALDLDPDALEEHRA